MRTKPFGRMCSKKRRKNSSRDSVSNFCSLWCAESRQPENDLAVAEGDQAVIGDNHAMSVAAQILEHVCGATEGTLQVHHPLFSMEWPQPGSEGLGLS